MQYRMWCRLSWYASVYCSCLERYSRLFLWTSERRRKCVLIAEKKRHKEGGRMKRRVDSWSPSVSLKGGDSEQQWGGRISAGVDTQREGESESHTDRGVCVVSVDVIGCLCVCVCDRKRSAEGRTRGYYSTWLAAFGFTEGEHTTTVKVGWIFIYIFASWHLVIFCNLVACGLIASETGCVPEEGGLHIHDVFFVSARGVRLMLLAGLRHGIPSSL